MAHTRACALARSFSNTFMLDEHSTLIKLIFELEALSANSTRSKLKHVLKSIVNLDPKPIKILKVIKRLEFLNDINMFDELSASTLIREHVNTMLTLAWIPIYIRW
ncbi:MAG: hypothetical protein AAI978_00500 [Candidatus Hodgkinia cicadicola]